MDPSGRALGLYCFKVMIEKVVLVGEAMMKSTPLKVRVHFLDLPPLEIEQTQSAPHSSDNRLIYEHFTESSTDMFYADGLNMVRSLQRSPCLHVVVYQELPDAPLPLVVGTTRVRVSHVFCNLVTRALICSDKHLLSDFVKGDFIILDLDRVQVGTTSLFARLLCYDKVAVPLIHQQKDVEDVTCKRCSLPKKQADSFALRRQSLLTAPRVPPQPGHSTSSAMLDPDIQTENNQEQPCELSKKMSCPSAEYAKCIDTTLLYESQGSVRSGLHRNGERHLEETNEVLQGNNRNGSVHAKSPIPKGAKIKGKRSKARSFSHTRTTIQHQGGRSFVGGVLNTPVFLSKQQHFVSREGKMCIVLDRVMPHFRYGHRNCLPPPNVPTRKRARICHWNCDSSCSHVSKFRKAENISST